MKSRSPVCLRHYLAVACMATILSLAGCATAGQPVFYERSGNYLALPRHQDFNSEKVEELRVMYGAFIRHAPFQSKTANATEDLLSKALGPSAYMRQTAGDLRSMMDSNQTWTILIVPENRDFMTAVLKLIEEKNPGKAQIILLGDSTSELEEELKRLNFLEPEKRF